MNKVKYFFILLITFNVLNFYAQKGISCDSAKALSYPVNTTVTTYTNDAYWFKITLDAGDYSIKITNYPGAGKIMKGSVYTGTCSSLSLIRTDSIANPTDTTFNINIHNTVNATVFYVKLYNRGGGITFDQTMATDLGIVGQIGFCPGEQVILIARPININGTPSYTWQPGGANTNSITVIPTNTITPTTYTLTYDDAGGVLTRTINIFPLAPDNCKDCEQVQNGHFEWFFDSNFGISNITDAQHWENTTIGSSDYFNTNYLNPTYSVPVNIFTTNTAAHSGVAYAGLFTYMLTNPPSNERELIQSQLRCELANGQNYRVSFFGALANNCGTATNLHAHLSASPISVTTVSLLPTPTITSPIINYTWTEVSGIVTGNSEQFITIGNFDTDANLLSSTTGSGIWSDAYYFIDDISVTPVPPTLSYSCAVSGYSLIASGAATDYTRWTDGINTYSGTIVTIPTPSTSTTYSCIIDLPCVNCSDITQTITINANTSPTLSVSNASLCIGNSVTLSASGASTYSWSTGATTSSTSVSPTIQTIYTVTGMANNCSATQTVMVSISPQYCCQSASFVVGTSSTSSTDFSNTSNGSGAVIDMQGTITFTANSTLTNYVIRMAPATTIWIAPNVTVTFSNCTIYSCYELWGGIVIFDMGGGDAGNLQVINSSIEDMYLGIYLLGATPFTSSSSNNGNVTIQNSTLNKNLHSIIINSFPKYQNGIYNYGLSVTGSTISSVYSPTSPLNTLKSSSVYTIYPYNNISNVSVPYTNFPRSHAGISLFNLTEAPVIIGDKTGSEGTNRFENLDFGIYVDNASLYAYNNHFINITGSTKQNPSFSVPPAPMPPGPDEIGVGILASSTTTTNIQYSVQLGEGTTTPINSIPYPQGNLFENCNKGVSITDYYEPLVKGNAFVTYTTSVLPTTGTSLLYDFYQGLTGVWVSKIKKTCEITNNYQLNQSNGIYTSHNLSSGLGINAYIKIEGNLIEAPSSTGYCREAIITEQLPSTPDITAGLLTIKNNTLQSVYNGIVGSRVKGGLEIADNPIIQLSADKVLGVPGLTSAQIGSYTRTGIWLIGCEDAVVANNPNITSTGTINATYYTAIKGIWLRGSGGTNAQINCNTISNMGRCMQFNNTSLNKVAKNVMNGTYQGFVLASNGQIGPQGTFSVMTNDNEWNGFTGGSAEYAETYTENTSNANTNSIFYVKPGSPYEPTQHYSNNGNPYITTGFDGIRVQSSGIAGESCLSMRVINDNNSDVASMRINSSDSSKVSIYETLASDTTYYEVYQTEAQYRNQQLVYDLIDNGEINTTQNLQDFYNQQQNGSFSNMAGINNAIAQADYATAQNLNNNLSTNNTIEVYQKSVNELLLKYLQHKPQSIITGTLAIPVFTYNPIFDDTELIELTTIANSCLDKYGNVVTQARVLLNNTLNRVLDFEDNCNPEYNQRKGKPQVTKPISSNIEAMLYPNPNNGNMILEYDLGVEPKGKINIFDMTGKLIDTYELQNSSGKLEINEEHLNSGIYYYSIFINEKNTKTDKIVIIK